jgi:hypothetical protein
MFKAISPPVTVAEISKDPFASLSFRIYVDVCLYVER